MKRKHSTDDFFVFDVETGFRLLDASIIWELNARPESFQFGCVYGKNFSKVIYSVESFNIEFLQPRYKGKTVFAHNAEYDLTTIYGNIFDMDPEALFVGSKFMSASNGNCKFADSGNIFTKTKVEKLGELLGMPKGKLGDALHSPNGITSEEINYCLRDCEIVWESLRNIFEFAGGQKISQAGLSLLYFRNTFLKKPLYNNEIYNKDFFQSYYGGRTECFQMGACEANVIDANSMYPFIMANREFPDPSTSSIMKVSIKNLDNVFNNFEGLLYCKVKHAETDIGFLPFRNKGKLCFPVGTFSGCWNFNELKFAIDFGIVSIVEIYKAVVCKKMESPFKDFVNTLYEQRINSKDDSEIYRIKIFLNSLYGKFGQRNNIKSVYIHDIHKQFSFIEQAMIDKTFVRLIMFNDQRQDAFMEVKTPEAKTPAHQIPSFASYVTSGARIHLLRELLEIKKVYNVVYCDTDSIFYEGPRSVNVSKKLGDWKAEKKTVTSINGLKNYEYIEDGRNEKIELLKGVPKVNVFDGDRYNFQTLMKTKEALRRNLQPGILTDRYRTKKFQYDKRIVYPNGLTAPICIS